MSNQTSNNAFWKLVVAVAVLSILAPVVVLGQEVREEFSANGLVVGSSGQSQTIDIVITRWTTPEERGALLQTLAAEGQDAALTLLMEQPETGFVRRRDGREIQGSASIRIHYAYQFEHDENRRTVVLVTRRPIGVITHLERRHLSDAMTSGIILELKKKKGKESGTGVVHRAVEISLDDETGKLKMGEVALNPINLRSVRRTR